MTAYAAIKTLVCRLLTATHARIIRPGAGGADIVIRQIHEIRNQVRGAFNKFLDPRYFSYKKL